MSGRWELNWCKYESLEDVLRSVLLWVPVPDYVPGQFSETNESHLTIITSWAGGAEKLANKNAHLQGMIAPNYWDNQDESINYIRALCVKHVEHQGKEIVITDRL